MMRSILKNLFSTLKKVVQQFPDDQKTISFLIASGKQHQGTTTLLKQAQMQQVHINEEYPLQLFYNQQGIILELNETWAKESEVSLSQLFKKLNRCHRHLKISGFLFFIDIHELMLSDDEHQIENIRSHGQHMQKYVQALDYKVRSGLIITKLDQVTGFTDFFSMAHELELQEPLGFSLPHAKAPQRISKIFTDTWSNFVSHLNQLMIQKVHSTRANKKRILIREFPLQIALFETKFLSVLKSVTHEKMHIHGIYFTCSEQKGKNINYLNQKIQSDFSLLVPISSIQSVNYKQFFIHGAIKNNQELTTYAAKPKAIHDKRLQMMLGSGFIMSLYILFHTINTHQILNQTQSLITNTQESSNWKNTNTLSGLEQYSQKLEHLPFVFKYLSQVQQLKTYLENTEQNIYQEKMATEIINILENECQQPDITASYQALKVYKALKLKREDQTSFILHWFSQYWKKNTNNHTAEQYITLLGKFIWKTQWPINRSTIENTENILNALAPEYLAYELINHNLVQHTESIPLPGFEGGQLIIPTCFLKKSFKNTQKQLVSEFEKLRKDSWVLDNEFGLHLQTQLVSFYARKYVHWWQHVSQNLRPKHFSSFIEAENVFNTLIRQQSFEKLISLIEQQTEPNLKDPSDSFNHLVASQFSDLHFAGQQTKDTQMIWQECVKFISMLNVLNDNGRASFQYLRSYFNQAQYNDALYTLSEYAKRLPQPSQTWVNSIQDDLWVLIQNSTKSYINHIWQEDIYQPFKRDLQPNYPFKNNTNEISISDFELFFAPNGKIQKFFHEYLQPFLNTTQAQWLPKEIENKKLPISEDIIQKMIQANIITNMFFPNNASQTRIIFSLEKMSLDPVITQLKLQVGSQEVIDSQQENLFADDLRWPENGAALNISTIDGKKYEIKESGEWALYRLLEQVNVINDPNDATSVQILLEINGNTGRYLIKTNAPINPFLPSILKNFNLQEKVIL